VIHVKKFTRIRAVAIIASIAGFLLTAGAGLSSH
jgi:hypothetical protein